MILPNFTDVEKEWEAYRICDFAHEATMEHMHRIYNTLKSRKHFPTFESLCFDDDKNNRWFITFHISTKEMAKEGKKIGVFCYTTYDMPQKRCEDQSYAGKGVILFNPLHLYKFGETGKVGEGCYIMDITPHAINRYTERYLIPNGLAGLDMRRKMEKIMSRCVHFDVSAGLNGDISAKKQFEDKGFLSPYDIITKEGGMFRGGMVSSVQMRMYTYISPKMMYENQVRRIMEMTREQRRWVKEGIY